MLRTHRAGKGPGGCEGWGLGSTEQKGPQDPHSLEGASEGIGPGPRAQQTSRADWAGETLGALPPILAPEGPSWHGNPSPFQATPQGHWTCLVFISPLPSVPPCPTGSFGCSFRLLGCQGPPHQHPTGALIVGRHELHIFPCRQLDSALNDVFLMN